MGIEPTSQAWEASDTRIEAADHTFWGKPQTARCAEPLLIAISIVISRHERPWAHRAATWAASAATGGVPRSFYLARTFRFCALCETRVRKK
jgi:hypothetical protein